MAGGDIRPVERITGPQPLLWLAWVCAAAAIVYVVGLPFWVTEYPMMTDFPFHTATASVFRHYTDAGWHFEEQFVLQPFAVPYVSLYALSALFMLVLSPVAATKLAAALLLALMPIGLMVLCWGMRKSPFLGLWGLVPVWGVLSHWGFVGFLSAMGLFAMSIGLALRVVERPSPKLQGWLIACLLFLFFTHVFRFPFALGALMIVGLLMHNQADSIKGLVIPFSVGTALFVVWWFGRAGEISMDIQWVWPPAMWRFSEARTYLFDVFVSDDDVRTFGRVGLFFLLTAAVLLAIAFARLRGWAKNSWVLGANGVVVAVILISLSLYVALPMEIGSWWYVYPRELTVALFFLPALLPNLPPKTWAHLGFVIWTAVAVAPIGEVTAEAHREFGTTTTHFREIVRELPRAPKLLYLVYDHHGSRARNSPYVHLPAYVQAERGGWISFHFAELGHSPLRYRSRENPNAVVPPRVPVRWEWSPQLFQLDQHGSFFDWFLVRRMSSPDSLFAADTSIQRVAHFEDWWLYHRRGPSAGPRDESP